MHGLATAGGVQRNVRRHDDRQRQLRNVRDRVPHGKRVHRGRVPSALSNGTDIVRGDVRRHAVVSDALRRVRQRVHRDAAVRSRRVPRGLPVVFQTFVWGQGFAELSTPAPVVLQWWPM